MDQLLEKTGREPALELLHAAVSELRERFGREEGGFAGVPEEREAQVLLFLLEYARRTEDDWSRAMAEVTLDLRGRNGGPLLAYAHLEAYAQTGRPACREAACDILDSALKERRLPGGGFAGPEGETVYTAWNARAIAALAKASRVLGEEIYLRAAREARLFLKTRLTQANGRLWHVRQGRTSMEEGRLADYGYYCWALAELYEADFSVSCLREAKAAADRMADIFRDPRGGFYDIDGDGGGAAALALAHLSRLTALARYRNMARAHLAWLAGAEPQALDGLALLGMVEELLPRQELVCASAGAVPSWLAPVGEEYRLAALAKTHDNSRGLENAAPFVGAFPVPETGERLYLCREGVCESTAERLSQLSLSPEGAPA